ncbi:MAG: tRNA preQ1(34) S-adenosylmethionine ribosyltransferase-isomerase QueA [Parvibaculales bacterium]
MKVEAFDFNLPEENIALRPAQPRDSARLLYVGARAQFQDKIMRDLPDFFSDGELIIVNNTKVIPARLAATRSREGATGAQIEVTLIERLGPVTWRAFVKPAKRLKSGDVLHFKNISARVVSRHEASAEIEFDLPAAQMDIALVENGAMPLPPYIAGKRKPDARDNEDYQTIFAMHDGAVAAPTAGLHFTPELISTLEAKNVHFAEVTLHVGPGTFLPVKVDDIRTHKMHSEWGEVSQPVADLINQTKQAGKRITCVGTTSLRLVESAASSTVPNTIEAFSGDTDIFISPGFQFQIADRLLTNFHLPKSTLFMLVSAFSGLETMQNAYAHAIDTGYRFYSYGDGCLLERQE